jgi:hypothetical protein
MKTPTSNIPSIGPHYADDLHLVVVKPFLEARKRVKKLHC